MSVPDVSPGVRRVHLKLYGTAVHVRSSSGKCEKWPLAKIRRKTSLRPPQARPIGSFARWRGADGKILTTDNNHVLARIYRGFTVEQAELFARGANAHGKKLSSDKDNIEYLSYLLQMEGALDSFCPNYDLDRKALQQFTQLPERKLRAWMKEMQDMLKGLRDEHIALAKAGGKTNAEVAREVGINRAQVGRIVEKRQIAEIQQTEIPAPTSSPSMFSDDAPWREDAEQSPESDSPLIPETEEPEPKDYAAKLEAVEKRKKKGWDTIARNMAKKEGRGY